MAFIRWNPYKDYRLLLVHRASSPHSHQSPRPTTVFSLSLFHFSRKYFAAMHSSLSTSLRAVALLLPLVAAEPSCPFAKTAKRDAPKVAARGDATSTFSTCSVIADVAGGGTRSSDWWPCQLRLDVLRQNSVEQDPMGADFDYAAAFDTLDCES